MAHKRSLSAFPQDPMRKQIMLYRAALNGLDVLQQTKKKKSRVYKKKSAPEKQR